MKTPFSSMLLVFLASVVGSLGAALLKAGADRLGRPLWDGLWRIGAGIAVFLGSSVFYVWGLQNGSLTVLYPMISLGYVWTLLWSKLFFGEPINRHKFVGLALVLIGVFFIGLGNE